MTGAFKPWHLIVLVLVLVLLFGAKRLPDAARSLGRSLRIIKAETKGLVDDDNLAEKAEPQHGREPLRPSEIQHPPQPGQPYQTQQPYPGQQAQQPPAAPYVDPVQRTHDR
jgi:sec-independent protein translocase protein TatA